VCFLSACLLQQETVGKSKEMESEARHVTSSSMDVDSHSEEGHHSNGDHAAKRPRKIPKLPMVRHGKKWYRARLLKDTGSRVQIGECLACFRARSSGLDMHECSLPNFLEC
jgi:hypothetical protein